MRKTDEIGLAKIYDVKNDCVVAPFVVVLQMVVAIV